MYYEPYEQKILKLARIRDKIYKLRFLILAVFLVVTGTIVGLVGAKGAFFEGVSIEVSYVYGEEITPKASAFMSKTSYEYYDGTEWSEEKPFMPGEYRVRAVAKKGFGGYGRTAAKTFTIERKALDVQFADSVTYGEKPSVAFSGFIEGDALQKDLEFTFFDILNNPSVRLEKDSFVIKNTAGFTTTDGYAIASDLFENRPIEILPRKITVTVENVKKIYDGTPLQSDKWQITKGELVHGDLLSVNCVGKQLVVGECENTSEALVTDENGEDIAKLYEITLRAGTLKIEPRPLVIKTGSAEKMYDGAYNEICNEEFWITGEYGLAAGDSIEVTGRSIVSTVCELENYLWFEMTTEDGEDRTDCYEITYEYGILRVLPRQIQVRMKSDQIIYNGYQYTDIDWEMVGGDGFANGEFPVVSMLAMQNGAAVVPRFAGEYALKMEEFFVMEDGIDRTENYVITREDGTLTIEKREMLIYLFDVEKIYDGESHVFSENDYQIDSSCVMADYEFCEIDFPAQAYVNVGTYEDVVGMRFKAYNNWFGDVTTENYQVTFKNERGENKGSTLQIKQRPVYLKILDVVRPYNGEALESNAYTVIEDGEKYYPILWWHNVEMKTEGSITEPGNTQNLLKEVTIFDGREDVTYNYLIRTDYGYLEVTKRDIYVSPLPLKKIYDGQASGMLHNAIYASWVNDEDKSYGTPMLQGYSLKGEVTYDYVVDAGTYANASHVVADSFQILNAEGMDVTEKYFNATLVDGLVEIEQRPLHIASADISANYVEGVTLKGSAADCRITKGSLLDGDTIEFFASSEISFVGSVVNKIDEVIIRDKDGVVLCHVKMYYDNAGQLRAMDYINPHEKLNYEIAGVECGMLSLIDGGNENV